MGISAEHCCCDVWSGMYRVYGKGQLPAETLPENVDGNIRGYSHTQSKRAHRGWKKDIG